MPCMRSGQANFLSLTLQVHWDRLSSGEFTTTTEPCGKSEAEWTAEDDDGFNARQ